MQRTTPLPPDSEQVRVAQAAGLIALGNFVSRVLGLLRVVVKAGLFGAGPAVSALDAAIRVPNTLFDLLVGGMVSSALVPVLSDYAAPERRKELWGVLSALLSVATLVVCVFLLLGQLLAPQVIWLIAGGMSAPAQDLAVDLLRLTLPAILFLSLAGILTGALYALQRFTFPAFTATIFNAAVVVVALAFGRRWGVHSMALGLVVGSLLQVALQVPGLRDARFHLTLDLRHPALRRIGRLYLPILVGMVVDNLLSVFLSYNLASRLGDSAISWMEYAAQVIQFPLGLIAAAISLAILPTLSRQASAQESAPFRATLAQGFRLVLSLVIPATVGLFLLATPLIELVFEHGDFTPADTLAVAEALRYHLPGLIFYGVDQLLIFAFYARKNTLAPAAVGVATTVLYAATAILLLTQSVLTLPLLILINSLKWGAHALVMLILMRRTGGLGDHGIWSLSLRATLASLPMGVVVWAATRTLGAVAPAGTLGELLIVAGAGGLGVLVYAALALALGIEEIHLLRAALIDGLRRLTAIRRPAIIPPSIPAGVHVEKQDQAQPVRSDHYDQSYFLSACEGYAEFLSSAGEDLSRRLQSAFALAEIEPGMRVLDVGCGRGEILRHCAGLGAQVYGIDYASTAVHMSRQALAGQPAGGVYQADAKWLPFADEVFDRVLMFDIVEHLHPWELDQALRAVRRVLRPGGWVIVHTAPNVWYDRYAYPLVRLVRTLLGQGERYPRDPRAIIPANLDVHVNEQSVVSLRRLLRRHGLHGRAWLDTPPQHRREGWPFRAARHVLFNWAPFRWFFEREVLAVAKKPEAAGSYPDSR